MDLKTIRFMKKISQYELSQKTKIPQSTISLLENGYRTPSERMHKLLAKALEISPENLTFEKLNK